MNGKKYLFGSIVTGITLCAVLAFNFIAVPKVLAATPETSEVKTISTESIAPAENTNLSDSTNESPNINAVSKEQAIDSALKGLEEFQYARDFKTLPCTVKYVEGTAPANDPLWVVIFTIKENRIILKSDYLEDMKEKLDYSRNQGMDVSEYEDYENNVEKHTGGTEGIDENGNAIIDCGEETHYFVVDVNALTGQYVDHGDYYMDNDPEDKIAGILNEKYGSDFSLTE